jgi:uncharacterized protein YjiS (DUF1127 family)
MVHRSKSALHCKEGFMASHVIGLNGNSLFAAVAHGWANYRERAAARRAAKAERDRTARELASYTDRELSDLRITRANIPEILDGTYRQY